MTKRNITRAVCFDPKQAAWEREKALTIKAAQDAEAQRKEHAQQMREHGKRLDQVEQCYRQHTPPQVAQADAMQQCGVETEVQRAARELGIDLSQETVAIHTLDLGGMLREGAL